MKRTIAAITTSRADYGHLHWPLKDLRDHPDIELRLIALGAHLSPEYGLTIDEIERDGFSVDERIECLLSSDTDIGMAKTIGLAALGLADALGRLRPDLLLLIADRYEMLAPAAVALALRIPIAHVEGGEVSEGAIDDAVRNALTKMSHIHLTPTENARLRVLAMGEESWRVHRVGAPSLDHLRRRTLLTRAELEADLRIDLTPPIVIVAHHPVTLARDPTVEADAVFAALEQLLGVPGVPGVPGAPGVPGVGRIIFCYPNADAGSRGLIERARSFCAARTNAHLFVNLAHLKYWSLLACAASRDGGILVGNSSSGIMESPALALPTVNIGIRQQGRERARNVIDAPPEAAAIVECMRHALSPAFRASLAGMRNPYGDGRASQRITRILTEAPLGEKLLRKRAVPLASPWLREQMDDHPSSNFDRELDAPGIAPAGPDDARGRIVGTR